MQGRKAARILQRSRREATQGGTGPGSPCQCPRLEQGLGPPSAGGCSQGQRGDGGAIVQRPPAALRGERDEGTRTQTWPRSRWRTLTDAFHRCSRASLFLHRYHRSPTCPLPGRAPHADKTSLILALSHPQPALLHWELATSHVSPGAAPQKIASLEAPQILQLCCYRTNPGGITRAGREAAAHAAPDAPRCPKRRQGPGAGRGRSRPGWLGLQDGAGRLCAPRHRSRAEHRNHRPPEATPSGGAGLAGGELSPRQWLTAAGRRRGKADRRSRNAGLLRRPQHCGCEPAPRGRTRSLPSRRHEPTSSGAWTPRKHLALHTRRQAQAHPLPLSQPQTRPELPRPGKHHPKRAIQTERNRVQRMAYSSFSFSSSSLSSPGQPSTRSALRSC